MKIVLWKKNLRFPSFKNLNRRPFEIFVSLQSSIQWPCNVLLHYILVRETKTLQDHWTEQRKDHKRPKLKFLETLGELSTVPVKIHAPWASWVGNLNCLLGGIGGNNKPVYNCVVWKVRSLKIISQPIYTKLSTRRVVYGRG